MVHYRGRYRRRPYGARRLFKMLKKRRRHRRKLSDPKKVQRIVRRQLRHDKRCSTMSIGRIMLPNHVVRKFSRTVSIELVLTGSPAPPQYNLTTTTGVLAFDYTIGDLINASALTYYNTQYILCNLLSFQITFYIMDTKHMTPVANLGTLLANYIQTQTTDTTRQPQIYVLNCNSASVQDEYVARTASTTAPNAWLANPNVQRLSQRNKAMFQWHMPKAYYPPYSPIPTVTSASIDASFAGPPYDEPHGFALLWNDYANYPNVASVTLAYKITSVWGFRERRAFATGP